MIKVISVVLLVLGAANALAQDAEPWVLSTGPMKVSGIPLDPFQPVPAWAGRYDNTHETIWVYATRSPFFFPPDSPLTLKTSGWWVVLFTPPGWTRARGQDWLRQWADALGLLESLPRKTAEIVFPSVLH